MIQTNKKDLKKEIKVLKKEIKVMINKYKKIAPKNEQSTIKKIIFLLPLCNNYNDVLKIHTKLKTLVKK